MGYWAVLKKVRGTGQYCPVTCPWKYALALGENVRWPICSGFWCPFKKDIGLGCTHAANMRNGRGVTFLVAGSDFPIQLCISNWPCDKGVIEFIHLFLTISESNVRGGQYNQKACNPSNFVWKKFFNGNCINLHRYCKCTCVFFIWICRNMHIWHQSICMSWLLVCIGIRSGIC